MKNKFLINDVSKLLRITPEALRFYEKKHIVDPKRDDVNGYRYYTVDDIRRLFDCKIYQSMGFSLTAIMDIFQRQDGDYLDGMIDRKEEEHRKTLEANGHALAKIRQVRQANEKMEYNLGKHFVLENPHFLASFHSTNCEMHKDVIGNYFWDCVSNHYNLFAGCSKISKDTVYEENITEKMSSGFIIDYESGTNLGITVGNGVQDLPPRLCVYTIFHAEPIVNAEVIKPTLKWIKDRNLTLSGDILCNPIKMTYREGEYSRIYEAWFPVD